MYIALQFVFDSPCFCFGVILRTNPYEKMFSLLPVLSKRLPGFENLPLRVQVLNNHILTPNLYQNYNYPNPKYPIIGYMDPLGSILFLQQTSWFSGSFSPYWCLCHQQTAPNTRMVSQNRGTPICTPKY